MSDDRKYVRVYYSIIDDERFADVYMNDAALALWLRLLLLADAVWPASTDLPRSARARPLEVLVDAGLVELVPTHRFRIHGLDPERGRRRDAAASAAAKRWDSASNAGALPRKSNAEAMPRRDEQRRDETSQAEQDPRASVDDPWNDPEGEALTWLAKHGVSLTPGNGYHRALIGTVEQHGINAVIGMLDRLAEAGTTNGDAKGFIFGTKDALDQRTRPNLRDLERDEREEERATVRRNRKPDPLIAEIKAALDGRETQGAA